MIYLINLVENKTFNSQERVNYSNCQCNYCFNFKSELHLIFDHSSIRSDFSKNNTQTIITDKLVHISIGLCRSRQACHVHLWLRPYKNCSTIGEHQLNSILLLSSITSCMSFFIVANKKSTIRCSWTIVRWGRAVRCSRLLSVSPPQNIGWFQLLESKAFYG